VPFVTGIRLARGFQLHERDLAERTFLVEVAWKRFAGQLVPAFFVETAGFFDRKMGPDHSLGVDEDATRAGPRLTGLAGLAALPGLAGLTCLAPLPPLAALAAGDLCDGTVDSRAGPRQQHQARCEKE
jgi:hypothetical protein